MEERSFGQKWLLVADGCPEDREMLRDILSQEFPVKCAADGAEALDLLRRQPERYAAVLLDTALDAYTVLLLMRQEPFLLSLTPILLSADPQEEVRSFTAGAADFFLKPYDKPDVLLARTRRAVELSKAARIVRNAEHDPLTGLYNQEAFYHNAELLDARFPDRDMDALLLDIDHFHIVNELHGETEGNLILTTIGRRLIEVCNQGETIACRKAADVFLVYCVHRERYGELLDFLQDGLNSQEEILSAVRIKMGVYAKVDRRADLRLRFDRAKLACNAVRHSYLQRIAYYDGELHQKDILHQRLMDDLQAGLAESQFRVYYQPKYDVRGEKPRLAGAEALIRWHHPEMGFITPNSFVPLFEENGLITAIDRFVWREAARQNSDWLDRYGRTVPISVNVSRVDIHDPNLLDVFTRLLRENRLEPQDLQLEITESAYIDSAADLVAVVERLRKAGFPIEMDDFGAGYSSLSMLAQLPIDIIKLDMSFIRNVFGNEKNYHIIRLTMGIKNALGVPIVVEGVETEEQLALLKELGCDYVQGYYFSPPVTAAEFEALLRREIAQEQAE